MRLSALTRPGLIFPELGALDRGELLRDLARRMAEADAVPDGDELFGRLWEREELGSTGIGAGVAVPHCTLDGLSKVVLAIGIHPKGIDFSAVDGQPVRLFFCIVSPSRNPAAHLKVLSSISRWVQVKDQVDELLRQTDPVELHGLLAAGEEG